MNDLGIVAVMLLAELFDVTVTTVSKAAMKKGMNNFIFVMYSNAFAASLLLPLTFISYRKRSLPRLTYTIAGQILLFGFISLSIELLNYFGIGYTSPTLASTMSDLIPAFTFILAILFRMEKFNPKANSTRAKSFGTLVSIVGALIITLYKGVPVINNDNFSKLLAEPLFSSLQFDWVFGAGLLATRSFLLSVNIIVQTWIIREYPAELVVILIRCIVVFVLSVPASLISERDPRGWRLRLDLELLAIGCSALLSLCFRSVLHIWAMGKKGPVFVSMFKPLEIVFAVIMGITLLGDSVYLGSVIGAVVIVIGFYGVIWGKSKEEKVKEGCSSAPYSPEAPLLHAEQGNGGMKSSSGN